MKGKKARRRLKESVRKRGRPHGAECGICAKPRRYRKIVLLKQHSKEHECVGTTGTD